MGKLKEHPIDRVTTKELEMALRLCNIHISIDIVDKIIDVVELIYDKGDKTTLKDISKLKSEWEDNG